MPSSRVGNMQPYTGAPSPMRIEDDQGNRMAATRQASGQMDFGTLPYDLLPGAAEQATDPRSRLELDFKQEANRVQQEYNRKWDIIERNERYIGPEKVAAMLADLNMKTELESNDLMQKRQKQVQLLDSIDAMEQGGFLGNGDKLRWNIIAGRDASNAMFPNERASDMVDLSSAKSNLRSNINYLEREVAQFEEKRAKGGLGNPTLGFGRQIYNTKTGKSATADEAAQWIADKGELDQMRTYERFMRKGGKYSAGAARMLKGVKTSRVPPTGGPEDHSTLGDKVSYNKEQRQKQDRSGKIAVELKSTGQTGWIPAGEYDPAIYKKLRK